MGMGCGSLPEIRMGYEYAKWQVPASIVLAAYRKVR